MSAKTPMSFHTVRRMSATQLAKLTKDQLVSALREAVKTPKDESEASPRPPGSPVSATITIEAIDKLLIQRLDPVIQTISVLTEEMRELKSKVQELEQKARETAFSDDDMIRNISNEVEQRISRAKNVVISGLDLLSEGAVEERKKDDANKCVDLLENLGVSDYEVVATHRIGKSITGKPQLLKVILSSVKSKHEIIHKAKQLKSLHGYRQVYINPDRTPLQQLQHKKLLEEWKSRREAGEQVVIFKQKVVARETLKNFRDRF